jgi:hypothetical protein
VTLVKDMPNDELPALEASAPAKSPSTTRSGNPRDLFARNGVQVLAGSGCRRRRHGPVPSDERRNAQGDPAAAAMTPTQRTGRAS